MQTTHAVGIDLGTTYSCIAYLNAHGEPVALPNSEGEMSTPSVVLFDENEVVVGTEALRNAVAHPDRVIQNSKRFLGDANHRWKIDGKPYTPIHIASYVLKKLLSAAETTLGTIEHAVITVPAQFSDFQRHATIEAGHRAGLKRVDIINEPVAAALCYVLGSEGLWFTELADEQRIMVYDLGGGTFDLSLVRYRKNEVSVIASSGDLNLGGIDWNCALEQTICDHFAKEFGADLRLDPASLQFLAISVEQAKRSLSTRPRAAVTCQHDAWRKTYQIGQSQFEKLTNSLVDRTAVITKQMLKDNKMGWAHVDVVLTAGGASRMPMIRRKLQQLSGTTLNTSLSPDLSIAQGAAYYAGMLLTNNEFARSILDESARKRFSQFKQQSVNARALGILIRDNDTNTRVPYYMIPANTPLPTSCTHTFGTVIKNQQRVRLQIIESGTSPDARHVDLGTCQIDELAPNLPEGSEIAVTITYDEQARVHVAAEEVTSGKKATAEIEREENVTSQPITEQRADTDLAMIPLKEVESSREMKPASPKNMPPKSIPPKLPQPTPYVAPPDDDDEIIPLYDADSLPPPGVKDETRKPAGSPSRTAAKRRVKEKRPPAKNQKTANKSKTGKSAKPNSPDDGEDEFWKLAD